MADTRDQVDQLLATLAEKILTPAGFRKRSPNLYVRTLEDEQLSHVIYVVFARTTTRQTVQFELRSRLVLEDHPNSRQTRNDRTRYTAGHDGSFDFRNEPRLTRPGNPGRPTLVVISEDSDMKAAEHELRRLLKAHLKRLSVWYLRRKRWALRYLLYVQAGRQRALRTKISLGFYHAARDNHKLVRRLEQSIREQHPTFVDERGVPDFSDDTRYTRGRR